jgi:signal transduction histidine kinase
MHDDAPDSRLPGAWDSSRDTETPFLLLRALLSDTEQRAQLLASHIERDAEFANWCRGRGAKQAASVGDDLPQWAARHLADLLQCSAEPAALAEPVPNWTAILSQVARRLRRLEELDTSFDSVLQRAKLDALKELAYGASHEINNPLANISMRAQSLIPGEIDPERRRKLAQIHVQAMRAHEMIADLMLFARPPKLILATVDARVIANGQISQIQSRALDQGTALVLETASTECAIHADADQIAVALRALIINALEALGGGGQVAVGVGHSGDLVHISVADNGPGVPEAVRAHLFDPFFSGREAGRGLGFGLTKAWRIVTDHSGDLSHHPTPNGGATFVIVLPAAPGKSDA